MLWILGHMLTSSRGWRVIVSFFNPERLQALSTSRSSATCRIQPLLLERSWCNFPGTALRLRTVHCICHSQWLLWSVATLPLRIEAASSVLQGSVAQRLPPSGGSAEGVPLDHLLPIATRQALDAALVLPAFCVEPFSKRPGMLCLLVLGCPPG